MRVHQYPGGCGSANGGTEEDVGVSGPEAVAGLDEEPGVPALYAGHGLSVGADETNGSRELRVERADMSEGTPGGFVVLGTGG